MDLSRFVRAEWDRLAGYAFVLAGAVALVFGFLGVRTAADVIDEISYLVTGGIGAIFLLGVGATLLLSADLHDDFRKLHRVEEKLDAIHRALVERHPDLVVDVRPAPPGGPDGNGPAAVADGRTPEAAHGARDGVEAAAPTGAAGRTPEVALARRPGDGIEAAAPTSAAGRSAEAALPHHAAEGVEAAAPTGAAGLLAVRRARRLALSGSVVAAGVFAAGAVVTANQAGTDRLTGGVGLALSGALLAAVAAGLMLGQLKGRLERRMLAALGPWLGDGDGGAAVNAASDVWVVDGLTLYHRAGCRALDGRAASVRRRGGLGPGLRPCGLCEPDAGG